tara:strand:- start:1498 stop:2295 length:798 start_codon:yes stop_codon:yes gene_type:complete
MNKETLKNTISSEIKEVEKLIKKSNSRGDHRVQNAKAVSNEEVSVLLKIPNNLYKAKRFYKTRPSRVDNDIPMSRNPGYYKYCVDHIEVKNGIWAEFGVFRGGSMKTLTKLKKERYPDLEEPCFGFDSFIGLPEDTEWGKAGNLTAGGNVPKIEGAYFYEGWFKDTIPKFNESYSKPLAFLHVDCDIYSSTVEVLEGMKDKIVSGTVVLFDDILSYSVRQGKWVGEKHEFKAFMEFVEKYNVEYEWLACVPTASEAACKIIKIDN